MSYQGEDLNYLIKSSKIILHSLPYNSTLPSHLESIKKELSSIIRCGNEAILCLKKIEEIIEYKGESL